MSAEGRAGLAQNSRGCVAGTQPRRVCRWLVKFAQTTRIGVERLTLLEGVRIQGSGFSKPNPEPVSQAPVQAPHDLWLEIIRRIL